VFGRRHQSKARGQVLAQSPSCAEDTELPEETFDGGDDVAAGNTAALGPYDADAGPDDRLARLDLGSLRMPVPEGAQLQIEVDPSGPVRAVHLTTELGQITLTAFAAPRSGGLWREVVPELVSKLRADGAQVGQAAGEWGEEIEAVTEQGVLRFVAVDGPRWMLRGVAAGPSDGAQARTELLRDVVRQTVVVRGDEPLPVRSPLPLQLPGALGEQLRQATAELANAAAQRDGIGREDAALGA
jgi:hypothetical protein